MKQLLELLRAFVHERNWQQFHTPRNLATALMVEAAEVLELFQWDVDHATMETDSRKALLAEELADVAIYSLMLADRCEIDLNEAICEKIKVNALKYPVDKSFGRATKSPPRGRDGMGLFVDHSHNEVATKVVQNVLLQPCGLPAQKHFQDTVVSPVAMSRISSPG